MFLRAVQKIFQRGGALADKSKDGAGTVLGHVLNRAKRNVAEVMKIQRAVHDDDRRAVGRNHPHIKWKIFRRIAVVNRQDFFARIAAFDKVIGQRVGNRQDAVHAVADGHGNFVAFEHLDERTGRDVGRPGFHETGEQVGEIHHDRHAELAFQSAGGHGGNRVLREQQIEFHRARGGGDHAFEKDG